MINVGTRVHGSLATVGATGRIDTHTSGSLDWWVASEERWHTPANEPTIRQRTPAGVPMTETLLKVPGGDVVQRVYGVVDGDGLVVAEFENASPRSVAIALSRSDLRFVRAPAPVPIEGITLPADAVVLPLGHGTTVRVGLGRGRGDLGSVPDAATVQRGWATQLGQGMRLVLSDPDVEDRVRSLRGAVVLGSGWDPKDHVDRCLAAGELVRLGDPADPWVEAVVESADRVARGCRRRVATLSESRALGRAADVLDAAGETRGAADIRSIRLACGAPDVADEGSVSSAVRQLADLTDGFGAVTFAGAVEFFSAPIPAAWYGQSFEVHEVPAPGGVAGCAVRWHGERPAIIWDVPEGLTVRCPGLDPSWTDTRPRGEALLAAPRA